MAKMGSFSASDLKKLQKQLNKIQQENMEAFLNGCAKELAARLLSLLIKTTQPGKYPPKSGKEGGTLRRGWTAQKSKGFEVKQEGDLYTIELVNPVYYASYVEFGHMKSNHKGWVPGKLVMTRAEAQIQKVAPKVIENRIKKFLGEMFE